MREDRNNMAHGRPAVWADMLCDGRLEIETCTSTPALLRMLVQRLSWSKTKETKWSGSKIPQRTSLGTR